MPNSCFFFYWSERTIAHVQERDEHSLYLCLLCLLGVCGGSFGLRLKVEWKEDDKVGIGIAATTNEKRKRYW